MFNVSVDVLLALAVSHEPGHPFARKNTRNEPILMALTCVRTLNVYL
jgi:hypothetical protein